MKAAAHIVVIWWPVIFRCLLYFTIAFLISFLPEIKQYADTGASPTLLQWLWVVGTAILAGLLTLRAFFDGTPQRHAQSMQPSLKVPTP